MIVKNKNSYTNKASKINTGNNPLLFFGRSCISVVFPVIRVFPVSLGTHRFINSRFIQFYDRLLLYSGTYLLTGQGKHKKLTSEIYSTSVAF